MGEYNQAVGLWISTFQILIQQGVEVVDAIARANAAKLAFDAAFSAA